MALARLGWGKRCRCKREGGAMNRLRWPQHVALPLASLFVACLAMTGPSAAATKSFVLSYFYPANFYRDDTCPDGLNPLPDVFFKRDLRILGLPQAEVN